MDSNDSIVEPLPNMEIVGIITIEKSGEHFILHQILHWWRALRELKQSKAKLFGSFETDLVLAKLVNFFSLSVHKEAKNL